jgi:uncharacterized protein YcbX
MGVSTVTDIWTYPIKSMQGERVTSAALDLLGIRGDRIWAVRDLERGGLRGAKKIPGLMRLSAQQQTDGTVQVRLPDHSVGTAGDPLLDERLSAWLERQVRLEPLPTADHVEHFRRGPSDHTDMVTELRAVFGRDPHEPLPDFSIFPPEVMEFECPPGTYYDCYPLMIMSSAALADVARALGPTSADIRRFRPSMVVEVPDAVGHPEFSWTGRTARLGEAEIEFLDPCPRCVMITHGIDDRAPADRSLMRYVVAELDQNLGVYARVVRPGRVAVGDVLQWQQPASP